MCNSNNSFENQECTYNPGSNYGALDIFAPAQNVYSAGTREWNGFQWVDSDTAARAAGNWSGTSFAAPIVTGIVARHLRGISKTAVLPGGAWQPESVWQWVLGAATIGAMPDTPQNPLNGSPNRLIYRGPDGRCRIF
jgi:hypothetical protein